MILNTSLKATFIVMLGLCSTFSKAANVTQINRYASVENKPLLAQVNPLLTVQHIHFPKEVVTVGDAVTYWLQYSGFKLEHESRQSTALKTIMAAPLPMIDRTLGPLTLQDGLTVLVGQEVFLLAHNALTRTVNFKLKPSQGHSA